MTGIPNNFPVGRRELTEHIGHTGAGSAARSVGRIDHVETVGCDPKQVKSRFKERFRTVAVETVDIEDIRCAIDGIGGQAGDLHWMDACFMLRRRHPQV